MTRPLYVKLCCELVDKIHDLLSRNDHNIRHVFIQTDSAGGHGGGRSGKGMEKSLKEVNKYALKYAEVPITQYTLI